MLGIIYKIGKNITSRCMVSLFLIALHQFAYCTTPQIDTLIVQLKWQHQFQFAGFYIAIEKGIYANNHLHVELKEGLPETNTTEEVLNGNAHFGIQTSNLLLDRANGKPVVVLAAIFQHSPLVLLTQSKKQYVHPQGLSNKKIMLRGFSDAEIKAMLNNEFVSGYEQIIHNGGMKDFINNKIDGFSCYYTDQPYYLDSIGYHYHILKPVTYGIDFYGDCIFSTYNFINDNPEITKRFLDASIQGWKYAMENKEETARMIANKYSKNEYNHLLYEANKMDELMLSKLVPVGSMNPGRWEHIMNTYLDLGMISEEIDLSDFIYNPQLRTEKLVKKILFILGALVLITTIIIIVLFTFNKQLSKKVNQRTVQLQNLNTKLVKNVDHINEINEKLEIALIKAARSEQLKSAFLQNISHEIRTPLNAITGFSTMLAEQNIEQDKREKFSELILINNERLLKIIENIISVSNIEMDEILLNYGYYNLYELCTEVLKHYESKCTEHLKLKFETINDETLFYIDKLRLRQILNNLLNNAFKFTKDGTIKFGYTFESENSTIKFYVSDTGLGIPKDEYWNIFKSFFKLDQFTYGVGLGLYICKTLVEKMGGQIWLESEKGKGSTFYFTIPLKSSPETKS